MTQRWFYLELIGYEKETISLLLKSILIKISVDGRKACPKLRSFHEVLVSNSKQAFSQKRGLLHGVVNVAEISNPLGSNHVT